MKGKLLQRKLPPHTASTALLLALLLGAFSLPAAAERRFGPRDPAELAAFLDSVVRKEMAAGKVPGAAVAVVRDGRLLLAKGWGWADLAHRVPVSPERTIFPVGSVSKPVTATAVMRLAERGALRLDADVNRYLHAFQVPAAFGRPITPADLLTHTAGLDVTLVGTAAPTRAAVAPLGRYLAENLPPRVRPPGELIAYSNHGFTLLGYLVEVASRRPFARAMEREVLRPLGMAHSGFDLPPPLLRQVAVGYERRAAGLRPGLRTAPPVHPNIGPAAGLQTTAADMARFMIAHLEGGGGVLSPAAARTMHRRHFTQDPRMPGMAYGFFESFEKGERAVFHGGGLRGFRSGLYLWPERRLGLFVVDNGDSEGLVWTVANRFLDHYFPYQAPPPPPPPADARQQAGRYAGRYLIVNQPRENLEKAGALRGREVIVADRGDGTLGIFGLRFAPVGPGLYRDAAGEEKVAFRVGANGRATHLFTEELFIGNQAWERLPWYATGLAQATLLLLLVIFFAVALFRRPEPPRLRLFDNPPEPPPAARRAVALGVAVSALNLLFLVLMILGFRQAARGAGLLYGVPPLLKAALAVPLLAAPLALAMPFANATAWRQGWWTTSWRLYYALLALCAVGFVAFLAHWNLLGFRW